ncbi:MULTISPECIES: DUF6415 family natural product biosynthesis protein [unclassified Streptomyces]|uniref:DUF6415 family natural product biosynthesis protein n=1 Tax=unclassified Streptomyces TaxID=2593676 RepID=UPI00081F0B29|nr:MULTISPECIES: DUF6415 family natural product biosynthesis protein [unclassified Streptomyces]MYZ36508.1 hypothetical protein [Streptomyces sp. SID4917]SCF84154.1 hypothetical protein GA0115259_103476 [Streptomyces sp. MnatMP-M17]
MGRQTSTISAVQTTIDKARAVGYRAGTHEELDSLATELRDHVAQMLPVARDRTDRMWRGSRVSGPPRARLVRGSSPPTGSGTPGI